MDWLKAKVLFIAAFLCLDLLLAWDVSRLSVPLLDLARDVPPASAPAAVLGARPGVYVVGVVQAAGSAAPKEAPELEVDTVGVDPRAWLLLGAVYVCAPAGALGPQFSSACRSPDGARVLQLGGALVYTAGPDGPGPTATPRAVADSVVDTVDPGDVRFAGAQGSSGSGDPTVLHYLETYRGRPLFDAEWNVTVTGAGVTATRFWVNVLPQRGPAQPVITAFQAVAAAGAALGAGPAHPLIVRGPVLFGYYYPIRQPPALPSVGRRPPVVRDWELVPVWRVQTAAGSCLYINAYSGQPEEAPAAPAVHPLAC